MLHSNLCYILPLLPLKQLGKPGKRSKGVLQKVQGIGAMLVTQHSTLHTQHSSLITHHLSLNTQYSTLNTQHSTFNTPHSTLNTQHSTLNTQHPTPNTHHSTLNTQHKTPNTNPSSSSSSLTSSLLKGDRLQTTHCSPSTGNRSPWQKLSMNTRPGSVQGSRSGSSAPAFSQNYTPHHIHQTLHADH